MSAAPAQAWWLGSWVIAVAFGSTWACATGVDVSQAELAELTGHSCLSCVAEVAAEAGVGRLVLVHINPLVTDDSRIDLAAARRIFANTEIGVDRMEIEF